MLSGKLVGGVGWGGVRGDLWEHVGCARKKGGRGANSKVVVQLRV